MRSNILQIHGPRYSAEITTDPSEFFKDACITCIARGINDNGEETELREMGTEIENREDDPEIVQARGTMSRAGDTPRGSANLRRDSDKRPRRALYLARDRRGRVYRPKTVVIGC